MHSCRHPLPLRSKFGLLIHVLGGGGGGFAYGRVSDHNAPLKSREKVVRRENEGKEGVLPIVGGKESPEDRRVTLLYWH